MFLSLLFSQEHFNVEILETGESTLFIFQDIIDLENGDEIGRPAGTRGDGGPFLWGRPDEIQQAQDEDTTPWALKGLSDPCSKPWEVQPQAF